MESRGASAEALADLRDRLGGALDDAGTRKAAQVGDQLFSVASLLRSTPSLRRVLTDVSVTGEARSGLVRELLAEQVDDITLDVAAAAVARRWTASRDLADALERLSEVAVSRSAGDNVDRLVDELFAVERTIEGDAGLRAALSDTTRSEADRAGLADTLLDGKVLAATLTLVKQALGGGYRSVTVALQTYRSVAASVRDERVAEVRTAHPLADADRERLERALARQYGRDVHLNVVVDPSLLGGLRVVIGDDVIDGTVIARLDQARRKLAG